MTLRWVTTRLRPLAFALLAACLAVCVSWIDLREPFGTPGPDIDQAWFAARAVLNGQDPYETIRSSGFSFPFFYPLTAAVASLPLALLPVEGARLVFVVGGAAIFSYAVGKHRPYLWPTFFGFPFLVCLRSAQWAPILTAAMMFPSLGWLAAVKPNLGVVMLAGTRSKRDALLLVGGGLITVAISLALDPHWPVKWWEALAVATHFRPLLLRPAGFLVLLALWHWRDPDARILLALALVPLTGIFYDMLPACLVCRTRRQAAFVALASHVSWMVPWWQVWHTYAEKMWLNGSIVLWFGLLPPLAVVLWRGLPAYRERISLLRTILLSPNSR